MKNYVYSGSIKNSQYAIYPIHNIYEALDMKKKQLFERIIIYLRNKLMTMMTENSYKYHSLRIDVKNMFDRLDVLNKKYENVLEEIEKFLIHKITVTKTINNLKNKDTLGKYSLTKDKIEIVKKTIPEKDKKPWENIKNTIKLKPIMKKNIVKKFIISIPKKKKNKKAIFNSVDTNKISSKSEDKDSDFINKLKDKYMVMEKNEMMEFRERIRTHNINEKELKPASSFQNNENKVLIKSISLSPISTLKFDLKKMNSRPNKEFSNFFLDEKFK